MRVLFKGLSILPIKNSAQLGKPHCDKSETAYLMYSETCLSIWSGSVGTYNLVITQIQPILALFRKRKIAMSQFILKYLLKYTLIILINLIITIIICF